MKLLAVSLSSCSAMRAAGQRELQDRHGRRRVLQDQRRGRAGRKRRQHRLSDGNDLRQPGLDVGRGVEEHLDHAHAVDALRLDVLDVVDGRRHRALEGRDHAPFHLFGGQAGVAPDHAHHRDVDVGEDVDRCAQDRQGADDQHQQCQNDEGIGPAQRQLDNPHSSDQTGARAGPEFFWPLPLCRAGWAAYCSARLNGDRLRTVYIGGL